MTRSLRRIAPIALVAVLLAGCTPPGGSTPVPQTAPIAWSTLRQVVDSEVQAGRQGSADRLLMEFQQAYPGTPEATDATFYRALYKLDPASSAGSIHDAAVMLDAVIGAGPAAPHRADAIVLRRIATTLEARAAAPTVVVKEQPAPAAKPDDSKAKDDEIARLRDELAKANAELTRVRKRVATPKP